MNLDEVVSRQLSGVRFASRDQEDSGIRLVCDIEAEQILERQAAPENRDALMAWLVAAGVLVVNTVHLRDGSPKTYRLTDQESDRD